MRQSGRPAAACGHSGNSRRHSAAAGARMLAAPVAAAIAVLLAALAALPAGAASGHAAARSVQAGQHSIRTQAAGPPPPAHRTVVSLTFDDGDADALAGARILHAHGLRGTFYIITGAVNTPGYLSQTDLQQLASMGNEVGGHTVSHLDLNQVSQAEARRQVCTGRDILAGWGYHPTSFAYPGAFYSPALEKIVQGCGYTSARIASGLRAPGCPGCALTESIPAPDPYAIRTAGQLDQSWSLAALEGRVRAAERQGGWLPLVFHHICTPPRCGPLSVSAPMLRQFAGWLAAQRPAGVVVRTVGAVEGGRPRPLVQVPPAVPHGVVNPSLERIGVSASVDPSLELAGRPGTFVRCWMPAGYGSSTVGWLRTRDSRTGRWGLRLTVSGYHSGVAEMLQQFDTGGCSLPVSAGRSYQLSGWYKGTVRTQFNVYYRDAVGRWSYWASSPYFARSSGWRRAVWETPPAPPAATGLSFGFAVAGNGSLTTDSYAFGKAPPDPSSTLMRWVLVAEGVAGATALGWGASRLIRRRSGRSGPGGPAAATPAIATPAGGTRADGGGADGTGPGSGGGAGPAGRTDPADWVGHPEWVENAEWIDPADPAG